MFHLNSTFARFINIMISIWHHSYRICVFSILALSSDLSSVSEYVFGSHFTLFKTVSETRKKEQNEEFIILDEFNQGVKYLNM